MNIGKVASIFSNLVRLLRTRLEIFAFEALRGEIYLIKLLTLTFIGTQFLIIALLILTVVISIFFWPDKDPYIILGLSAVFYGASGVGILTTARSLSKNSPNFSVTLEELERDASMLSQTQNPRSGETPLSRESL